MPDGKVPDPMVDVVHLWGGLRAVVVKGHWSQKVISPIELLRLSIKHVQNIVVKKLLWQLLHEKNCFEEVLSDTSIKHFSHLAL